jgi:hypothetical protein
MNGAPVASVGVAKLCHWKNVDLKIINLSSSAPAIGINAGTIEKNFRLVLFVEDALIWECSTQNPVFVDDSRTEERSSDTCILMCSNKLALAT